MQAYLIVFLGAGLGGAARHGVNLVALRLLGSGFPYGTLVVNVSGSLVMGLMAGIFALRADPGQSWRLLLTTGVLGGFTTFSTFSLEAALLYERGQPGMAAVYVAGSVGLALAAMFAGLLIVRHLS
jgi:fluoride exporter